MKNYVAYFRVSTTSQGKSGLGLKSQKQMVDNFVKSNNGILINEFTEIETGTSKRKRTEIYNAISFAKQNNATLIIAKIDRLARNVYFVSSLMETGVEFVACDLPQATNFTIHLYAALAEMEANLISTRTKNALEIKKKQGFKLGSPQNLTEESRAKGLQVIKEKSRNNQSNIQSTAMIMEYKAKGYSFDKIATKLNQLNFKTSKGFLHNAKSVQRLYQRQILNYNLL